MLNKGVDFYIYGPNGKILVVDFEKTANTHLVVAPVTGDYKFCFKNTAEYFSHRIVFFEMVVDVTDMSNESSSVGVKFRDIDEILSKLSADLVKVRYLQELIKSSDARNRNTAETVRNRLELQSLCEVVINVFVGVFQVILVRSVVDTGCVLNGLWKSRIFS